MSANSLFAYASGLVGVLLLVVNLPANSSASGACAKSAGTQSVSAVRRAPAPAGDSNAGAGRRRYLVLGLKGKS
jgi:hypothetical protein